MKKKIKREKDIHQKKEVKIITQKKKIEIYQL